MAIKNYSTTIGASRTAGKIQGMLAEAGALCTMVEYTAKKPVSLSFQVDTSFGLQSVRLPINAEGMLRAFKREKVPKNYQTLEQAERTAWRNCEDWIAAQLAMIDGEQLDLAEIFLPQTITKDGSTVYELFERKQILLTE